MIKIQLYFNPYTQSTRLIIDGRERFISNRRLDEFIVGQPLDKWLAPYIFSYQKWHGLLPELMDEFNDDELKLEFFSLPEYFSRLGEEFDKQTSLIEERGYSSDLWHCLCEEAFLPEDIRAAFIKFVTDKKKFAPDQFALQLFDSIEYALSEHESASVEKLREIYGTIQETIRHCQTACRKLRRQERNIFLWEVAERELLAIFDKNCEKFLPQNIAQ